MLSGQPAAASGVRLVAVDRPGYGISTPHPRQTFVSVADDLAQLGDSLRLDRFAVLGVSGGGSYAYAAAYALPDRVSRALVVSGAVPPTRAELRRAERDVRLMHWLGRSGRLLLPLLATQMRRAGGAIGTEQGWEQAVRRMPPPDRAQLGDRWRDPDFRSAYAADVAEAYRSTAGFVADCRCLGRGLGFDPARVRVPVEVWQGTEDRNVIPAAVQRMAAAVPDCRLHLRPGGHLLVLQVLAEVLRRAAVAGDLR
jgi:pimeloyl-ACP methyl ester carboxylesterase